jgi:hypothetical protein
VGEKSRSDSKGDVPKAWDHDTQTKEKLVPLGLLVMTTTFLTVIFGKQETSDFWVDCLKEWWSSAKTTFRHIKRLVIYLDNGPHNFGYRTQFLKRMIQFADWSGLEIRLVYYPPYHSKYNPIERCWGALEKKWNGALLNCLKVVLYWAQRMTWCGKHPEVKYLDKHYEKGVTVPRHEMTKYEARLQRSKTLPKYDITIAPKRAKNG